MTDKPDHHTTRLRTFGRRQGHKLKPRQVHLMETLLPQIALEPETLSSTPSLNALFPDQVDHIWFEIGFGGGEHAAWQVETHQNVGLIGCEPFLNGVASLLSHIDEKGLKNRMRLYNEDARALLDVLPDGSLDRVFLLFPDPWRKKRHFKRRFIGPENLKLLARVLKVGAELRVASDHMPYIDWTLFHLQNHSDFTWICDSPKDWRARPDDWPQTRYEKKARRQGKNCVFLRFKRV